MKKIYFLTYMTFSLMMYGEINIKIFEPLRFGNINTRSITSDYIVGSGILEISTNNIEEDSGKKLKFIFPKIGVMTNKKRLLQIEKYQMEIPDNEFIITKNVEHVKIYAVVDKRSLSKDENYEVVEGEYVGYVPIVVSQYGNLLEEVKKNE